MPFPPIVARVLVVDDLARTRITTKWFLDNLGYAVEAARDADEALKLFSPAIHDAVVVAHSLSGIRAEELAMVIKMRARNTPVLVYGAEEQVCPANTVTDLAEAVKQAIEAGHQEKNAA